MSQIAVNRCIRIVVGLAKAADMYHIHFDYGASGAISGDVCANALVQWDTDIKAKLLDAISSEITLQYVYAFGLAPNTVVTAQNFYQNIPGTIVQESLPTAVCAVIRLTQLDVSSRSNGRLLLPGLAETSVVDGLIDPAYIAASLQPFLDALDDSSTHSGLTWKPIVLQRNSGGAPITPIGNTIVGATVSRSPGTIRRRTTELLSIHA